MERRISVRTLLWILLWAAGGIGLFSLVQFGWGMDYPLAALVFIVGWFLALFGLAGDPGRQY
jgi:hypothetical protein